MAKRPEANARRSSNKGRNNGGASDSQSHEDLKKLLKEGFERVGERLDKLEGTSKQKAPFEKYFELTTSDSFAKAAEKSKAAQSMAYLHFHQARQLALITGVVGLGKKLFGGGTKPAPSN